MAKDNSQTKISRGDLGKARAHWVTRNILFWQVAGKPGYQYALHYEPKGNLHLEKGKIVGGKEIPLDFLSSGPSQELKDKFPHLSQYTAFQLHQEDLDLVPDILKGQLALSVRDKQGQLIDATGVQIPGVLDDLYTYYGPLGVYYQNQVPVLRVWAPTAQSVNLLLYSGPDSPQPEQSLPMNLDAQSGVWSCQGNSDWTLKYYLYEVHVYVPSTGKVEHNQVTDPYSISLAMNSTRSQIVDLADPSLMPSGWQSLQKPPLAAFEDIVIYELHVRDFSINDQSLPPQHRGRYLAFTDLNSDGMRHLKALAQAGLTHIHLMPVFDFTSVNENANQWVEPDHQKLVSFPGDSKKQQELVGAVKDRDGFNWGYDPFHYTTPEGSYSTDPNGIARIKEFRQMVQALSQTGLRVIMDVVYNHTTANGQNKHSVLDKVVPGYYHRLNPNGDVETSTCCPNTASEHAMMEKLVNDSILTWAKAYKIDGFRFDLMGHQMLSNMLHLRQLLDSLTIEKDGVDGSKIYLYGEGWDFGEVTNNARGKNATQQNIGGTGIGTFNDRLRDAARGGHPFSSLKDQGYLTGLFLDPNQTSQGSPEAQRFRLLMFEDHIRLSLAGNLKDYPLVLSDGNQKTGEQIDYNGKPLGYTRDPQENVVYVSSHDNQTLFDAVQMKAPADTSLEERIRIQNLGNNLVMLSQGVPFFLAGDDMLRSKSLDINSYNSGDWFNAMDFTYQSDNFAVGLPPAWDNQSRWPEMQPVLANQKIKPGKEEILKAVHNFQEFLRIRKSSPLFRLRTSHEVIDRVKFYNTGPQQIPGLIVMGILDANGVDLDPQLDQVLVFFNANPKSAHFSQAEFKGQSFQLHPILAQSSDPVVRQSSFDQSQGAFTIPGRTTAVFIQKTIRQQSSQ